MKKGQATQRFNVTILGDSRVFDTYFTDDQYSERYGYDKTFPFLWRRSILLNPSSYYDVVHIPDHFRVGTIENNTIRVALTDPDWVILCDGIWETLLNKSHFLEFATKKIQNHELRSGESLAIEYSTAKLKELFLAGELSSSPQLYSKRIEAIASYFLRRRRRVLWMNLAVPGPDHLEGRHYAGSYKCLPEWSDCLRGVNKAVSEMMASIGGSILDVNAMMAEFGGPSRALIDQWHFSSSFHEALAVTLERTVGTQQEKLSEDHVSRRFLTGARHNSHPVSLCGNLEMTQRWAIENSSAQIEAQFKSADEIPVKSPQVVILFEPNASRAAVAATLLKRLPNDSIVVFPEELGPIVNPSNRGY